MSAVERQRRYRLRIKGKRDGIKRICAICGSVLSIHNGARSHTCAPCYHTHGETCKRGHSLESFARTVKRGNRTATECSECKRIRDKQYARNRRARQGMS